MPAPTDNRAAYHRIHRRADLLRSLQEATDDLDATRRNADDLVRWCRDEGCTWEEIGSAMGTTAGAARQAWLRRGGQPSSEQ